MLNNKNEAILFQEKGKINKLSSLIYSTQTRALTANDKKLHNIIIRKLCSKNRDDINMNELIFTVSELADFLSIKNRNDIYTSLDNLANTDMVFLDDTQVSYSVHAKMISSYTKPLTNLLDYQDGIIYDKNKANKLVIAIDTQLTRVILRESDYYAKLDILEMNKLSSSYSVFFYEIFLRALGKYDYNKKNMTESDIRVLCRLEDKYLIFKEFNRYVIKKSIDELNKHTSLTITYTKEKNKSNKKYTYKFTIEHDKRYSFNRFKRTLEDNFTAFSWSYKKREYVITKDLETENKNNYIIDAKTTRTITTELATEIYQYMYELFTLKPLEFLYRFTEWNDLDKEISDDFDEEILKEELTLFNKYYDLTI